MNDTGASPRGYSTKRRIKTSPLEVAKNLVLLREDIPLKEGLRLSAFPWWKSSNFGSERIFH